MKFLKADYKKQILLLLLGFAVLTVNSCDITDISGSYVFKKSPVTRITSIKIDDGKVEFGVNAEYPNGCGSFSHSEYTKRNSNIYIEVYGKQKDGATCTQEIKTIKGKVELPEPVSGHYTFRFWQSDSASLDTTLVF